MFNNKKKKKIIIEGMSCIHCSKKVETALSNIDGVKKVKVNLEEKCALVTLSKDIDDKIIKDTIENLDYKVISIENI